MRKLKLQMQVSVDGYVAGPGNEMDWMQWDWDEELKEYVQALTEPVDCILLGRKLAEGFVPAWTSQLDDPKTADDFSHKMVETPKIVFSRTLDQSPWANTTLAAKEDLKRFVSVLKEQPGGDIIVYGGVDFAADLIRNGLVDEYYLFINPAAIGKGRSIFQGFDTRIGFKLAEARSFSCGIAVLRYQFSQ